MEARYGLKKRAKRQRSVAIAAGSALLVALLAWIVWAAFGQPASASGTISSFKQQSNIEATMVVSIVKPANMIAICQVSAVTGNGSSVGSKQVRVGANQNTSFALAITTVQPATDAVVELCVVK